MHRCVETAHLCYYFYACALGRQHPSTQSTSTFLGKNSDRKSTLWLFQERWNALLPSHRNAGPAKPQVTLLEVFLLQLRENFALHCLPHLCWSMPWGHQCCFSAGDRQKASFHLVHIWGRQQNTRHVSIFLFMFQHRNIHSSESRVGMNVSRQAISCCNAEAALAVLLHRDSLHSKQRCTQAEQWERREGDTSLLCFRLGNVSGGNSHLLLYDCRAGITYPVLWLPD